MMKMNLPAVLIFLCFFITLASAQPTNVDSLESLIRQAKEDTTKWQAVKGLVLHYQAVDPATGKKYGFQLLEIAQRLDEKYQIESLLNLGNLYSRTNQLDSVEFFSRKALQMSQKTGNEEFEGRSLITLGGVDEKRGELSEAIENYRVALQKVKEQRDSIFVLNNLGLAYVRSNQPEQALQFYLKALKIAGEEKPNRYAAVISGNLSRVYQDMDKFPEAEKYLKKAIEIKEKIGDKPGLTYSYLGLGSLYFFENIDKNKGLEFTHKAFQNAAEVGDTLLMISALSDLSTMYLERKQNEAAANFIGQGLGLVGNNPMHNESKAYFLKNMAILENEKSNFREAFSFAQQALEVWPSEVLPGLPDVYFELYTAQKGIGNYKNALEYHEKYASLKDSLNNVEKTEKVAEIDAKYQTAEKDKAIALLEKDKAVQAAEIEHRKTQALYVTLAAIFILLLSGLLLFRNRYQQTLKLERMRTSIASDLHDEVGSSLSHLNFLVGSFDLENAPELTAKSIEKSKEIMQKTASDIRDVVWAIDARRDKTGDLLDRMEDFAFDLLNARNITYHFSTNGIQRETMLNPFVRQNIYLIFKEAVNNIAKHSNANEVNISLSQKGDTLEMKIADNGKVVNNTNVKGQGLENMRLRAKRIGGEVEIGQGEEGFVVRLTARV